MTQNLEPGDIIVTRSVVEHVTEKGHVVSRVSDGYLFLSPADVQFEVKGEPSEPPCPKQKPKPTRSHRR